MFRINENKFHKINWILSFISGFVASFELTELDSHFLFHLFKANLISLLKRKTRLMKSKLLFSLWAQKKMYYFNFQRERTMTNKQKTNKLILNIPKRMIFMPQDVYVCWFRNKKKSPLILLFLVQLKWTRQGYWFDCNWRHMIFLCFSSREWKRQKCFIPGNWTRLLFIKRIYMKSI